MMGGRPPLPTWAEPAIGTVLRLWGRFRSPGRLKVGGFVAGVILVAVIATFVWWLPQRSNSEAAAVAAPPEWRRPSVSMSGLAERSGVKLVRVAVTAGGGLLDLRYQVVDPGKALSIHNGRTPPAIVDERTGLVFSDLLMGHAHSGELKAAVTYYLVFENTGNWVRRGDKVTVLLGDAQVEDVVVQ
jgi:hypothetical protein